jgi:hypothetical protein
MQVPFLTSREMLELNHDRELSLWELAMLDGSRRAGIPEEEVFEKMTVLYGCMETAVSSEIRETRYIDRILPAQSRIFKDQMDRGQLLGWDLANRIIMYTGTVPGTARSMDLLQDQIIKALLAAGINEGGRCQPASITPLHSSWGMIHYTSCQKN